MKRRFGLVMAAIMVISSMSPMAFAFTNPLKNYNLYEDVNPQSTNEREQVMSEVLINNRSSSMDSYNMPGVPGASAGASVETPKRRNEVLRESSRNVYASTEETPGWLEGPSFYPNPSFNSIVEKYRRSDFAGCLQECISYVRKHPYDTLGFYYLAMCYTKVSDMDNAVKAYEKVIALNDNPMIVKYATNGRNCIMGNDEETCYPNVNEPELLYPYANLPASTLTPVDPEELVRRNFALLKQELSPLEAEEDKDGNNSNDPNSKDKKPKIVLPFGKQDEKLDAFINAPYGNGLSPELNKEYKQLQLRKIQDTVNNQNGGDAKEKEIRDLKDIKKFDNQKSEASDNLKLAYEIPQKELEALSKDPEYIRSKQEYDELRMLLGGTSESKSSNVDDFLPYMTESGSKNLSPEVIQTMMMKSVMGDLNL